MNQTPTRVPKMVSSQTPVVVSFVYGCVRLTFLILMFRLQDSAGKTPKPKPPKLVMPYMKYTKLVWDDIKNKHPDLKIWEISKIIGQMWRELDESEKSIYTVEYDREKQEYEREKLEYEKARAAYERSIQKTNENADLLNDDRIDSASRMNGRKINRTSDTIMPRNVCIKYHDRMVLSEKGVNESIEPNHDDIIDAQQRFNNNNQFMGILFNQKQIDIPEKDENKLKFLSDLQESILGFKNKLESEIDQLNNKYTEAKRKREEEHEKFLEEIKKNSKKVDTNEIFQKMLDKALENIKEKADKFQLIKDPSLEKTDSTLLATMTSSKTISSPNSNSSESTNNSTVHN